VLSDGSPIGKSCGEDTDCPPEARAAGHRRHFGQKWLDNGPFGDDIKAWQLLRTVAFRFREKVMISKPLAFGLLAAGCVVAAAGGAFLAVRQNEVTRQPAAVTAPPRTEANASAGQPVSETEAIVATKPAEPALEAAPVRPPAAQVEPPRTRRASAPQRASQTARREPAAAPAPSPVPERTPPPVEPPVAVPTTQPETPVEPARPYEPPPAVERQFEEVVVPASSVIGLQVTTALSSERTQVEDRVEARVTRDVTSVGRVAIPAGSRVIGSVTLVERGGKVKERARLGVRFHTLVLADGSELQLRTEGIFREGESPTGESARKIGGAAVGGAILGAILGGGKGAIVGGATGAAGGTAVVMSGDRNAATLPSGTIVTVRLTSPLTVDLPRDK
jgi:hypothetical protein